MKRLPRAIVWDLDGTLVDSAADLADSLNILLREKGREQHKLEAVRGMIGDGVAALVERGFAGNGATAAPVDTGAMVTRFMEIYRARATRKTALYEGALETLNALSVDGFAHGLCTNKPWAVTMDILSGLGIANRFGAVIGGDSTPVKKPDPGPVLACLEQLGVHPGSALLVGDSPADLGAARAAGLPVILVTYGYSREPVASLGADALADKLDEIPALLRHLKGWRQA